MNLAYVDIKNFRGISSGRLYFDGHTVIIGDNNAGKSTVFEAIDLVLGPDRLSRTPVVDEHDFYNGLYHIDGGQSPRIEIEVLIVDLEETQISKFKNNLEFYNIKTKKVLSEGEISEVDDEDVKEALRIKFVGEYSTEDDDFIGETYFCSPLHEDSNLSRFSRTDKRECGFLYLRALRTGSRALSMERGSLLDIILRIREIRPKMWEDILSQLKKTDVATDPEAGIKPILESVQKALKEFVPVDWGTEPILRVSDLTREHLRRTLTVFMSTGAGSYHAPFQHQGTGTINTLVLALLTIIAEEKKNVIFAMEEPEIAIPPYTQKRIIHSIQKKSSQAIFTSHSPFVLEEFSPEKIKLIERDATGYLTSRELQFPSTVKPKAYNSEFRLRFSEALLAKKILLTEGITEATAYFAAARRLNELAAAKYASLEELGIAIFNVMSDSSIASYGDYFRKLGKKVFAVFDKQESAMLMKINETVDHPFESKFNGFEKLIIEETDINLLKKFYKELVADDEWPSHIPKVSSTSDTEAIKNAIFEYLRWAKGSRGAADLFGLATEKKQPPKSIRKVLREIKAVCEGSKEENDEE
jgi:putative ATP-dependent endonuclease of the OLD family